MNRELRAWRAVTTRLPPLPKMLGVANHVARRLYLRAEREPVIATVRGLRMELDPADLVEGLLLFAPQLVDRRELAFLEAAVPAGGTFLDLGAHVGLYTLVLARKAGPDGHVVAVEPEPTSAARLARNLALNGLRHVDVVRAAVSDRAGGATLHVDRTGNRGSSTVLGHDGFPVAVDCVTVPALLEAHGLARLDAAKLDLEGMEYRVLRRWMSEADLPRALVVEHDPKRVARAGGDAAELLAQAGYRMRRGSRHNLIAERP